MSYYVESGRSHKKFECSSSGEAATMFVASILRENKKLGKVLIVSEIPFENRKISNIPTDGMFFLTKDVRDDIDSRPMQDGSKAFSTKLKLFNPDREVDEALVG